MEDNKAAEKKISESKTQNDVEPKPCKGTGVNPNKDKPIKKCLNMAKLSKAELLRLLSILEGELEARDIYITTLQAQLNVKCQSKQRYFQHKLTDPYAALMRDNEAISGTVRPDSKDNQCIEPLPLLDKLVLRFRTQQMKVQQHISLGEAYYQFVNEELLKMKKKQELQVNCGDASATRLNERIQLELDVKTERHKSKILENKYKKLVMLITHERKQYRKILTLLLEDRALQNSEDKCKLLGSEEQTKIMIHGSNLDLEDCVGKESGSGDQSTKCVVVKQPTAENTAPVQTKVPNLTPGQTKEVTQVSEVRPSSVIERTKTVFEAKPSTTETTPTNFPTLKPRPVLASLSLPLFNTSVVSSPTSGGAANFALDSPNEPHKPFHPPTPTHAPQRSNSFQAAREKFQRSAKISQSVTDQPTKQRNNLTPESHNSLPSVGKHEADRKEILTKTTDKKFKPQPPKPLKQKSTPNVCEKPSTKVKKSDVRPPPLPPKKPSIYQKLNNSKTPRKIRPESKEDNKEKVTQVTKPSNGKPPNLNLTKPIKPIMKRPTSLNSNNSNNSDQDLPENMSAQQRLFHQQEDGILRSPVTKNIPKSLTGFPNF